MTQPDAWRMIRRRALASPNSLTPNSVTACLKRHRHHRLPGERRHLGACAATLRRGLRIASRPGRPFAGGGSPPASPHAQPSSTTAPPARSAASMRSNGLWVAGGRWYARYDSHQGCEIRTQRTIVPQSQPGRSRGRCAAGGCRRVSGNPACEYHRAPVSPPVGCG